MRFKVRGGTTSDHNTSLCLSCRSATVINGPRLSDQIVACGLLRSNNRISFAVTECSEYASKAIPSLWHMEDIAWILRSDPKRKQVGFVRAKELKYEERHTLSDDE
jgi:hypothetical protein